MNYNTLKDYTRLPVVRASAVASLLVLTSGCVVAVRPAPAPVVYEQTVPAGAPGEVVVTEEPPAPIYETVGIAPGPGYLWIGGYYHWNGRWVWYRGHYARPPHPGAAWIRARYEFRGGRRVYIAGYWR
jgi:hypothetical protein